MDSLSNLINTALLRLFGENTVVPLAEATATLAGAVGAVNDKVDDTGLSVVDGKLCMTYDNGEEE